MELIVTKRIVIQSLCLLFFSCVQPTQDEAFRKQIDEIKRDDIPTMNFTVSSFSIDSSKYWNVVSEIKNKQDSGIKTTSIRTDFLQNGKILKTVSNNLVEKMHFQGQLIASDLPAKVVLYYLLKDEKSKSSIYKIECNSSGKYLIELIDSTTSSEWTVRKSEILKKN